jgi:hypothetical protein
MCQRRSNFARTYDPDSLAGHVEANQPTQVEIALADAAVGMMDVPVKR